MGYALHNPQLRSKVFILINESFLLGDYVHWGARKWLPDSSQLMSSDKPDKRLAGDACACGPINKDHERRPMVFPIALALDFNYLNASC